MMAFFLANVFVTLALAIEPEAASVAHRLPVAASMFPMSSQPGQSFEAEILGEFLGRAQRVIFHGPDVSAEVLEAVPTRLRVRVRVGAKATWGEHAFQVVTPRGASGPLLLHVTDQPHAIEREPNSTLAEAQMVQGPVTVMGRLNVDGDFDFFKLHVEKGARWIFDLRAARNGSGLDAALFLLDSAGRKLDYNEEHFIWDPFLAHEFAEAGDYVLVVQPTHLRNDPNFAYELDIRQAPQLDTVSPLSLVPGISQEVTLYGAGLYGEATLDGVPGRMVAMEGTRARALVTVPVGTPDGPRTLSLLTKGGRSNSAQYIVDSTPHHSGGETISPPVSITGVAKYRQPDRYRFQAKAGEALVFEVRGQRYGSPVDLSLRILDSSGKEVGKNDDFTYAGASFYHFDPRIMQTFTEAGEYMVELRNQVNVVGENAPYQLLVRAPMPSYELQFGTERPWVDAGGSGKFKVTAMRMDGHKAPIALKLEGLPDGVTAEPVTIAENDKEAEFELKATTAKPGTSAMLKAGDAWRSVRVSSGGGEGATYTRVNQALLVVTEKVHFSLEAQATSINLPRGGAATIPVAVTWEKGFGTPVEFRLENLPAGVTLEPMTIQPGTVRADLKLRAAQEAPLGRSPRVAILGQAGDEMQEAPRVTVQVD